ncbi:uncharacterized protein AKAW2_10886A [Aspergillus luchuensis]|uniref:Uncharacterized protein n=1 Tax=Aspergillus kawachii TaxID=1069201 RepID=A0A7R7W018_ASPKA|nr:uncharacterized protein AKAW2_10886A [Aspergillus luchuensis]BCR93840.1 hypothetical protein AKAW2_10886A [Aspergillus luchuensis]
MLLRPQLNFRSSSFLLSTTYSAPPRLITGHTLSLDSVTPSFLRLYFAHPYLLLNTNLHRYLFHPSPAH